MKPLSNLLKEKKNFKAHTFNDKNLLNEISSNYILKSVFNFIEESQKLNLIKYNKSLQKKIDISFIDNIVIELKIKKKKYDKVRFINPKYEKFCLIYFNDKPKRIKRNYISNKENISKIKIVIYDNKINSLNKLFYECECIEEIKFIKLNRKNIDLNELPKTRDKINLDFSDIKINNDVETVNMRWCAQPRTNIKITFEKTLDKLIILDLGGNYLENINEILRDREFKSLKELYLFNNSLDNLEVLREVKMDNLELLDLSNNQIKDISFFKNVNFKGLKKLYLKDNLITDIEILGIFNKLEILSLRGNNKILPNEDINLEQLKELDLSSIFTISTNFTNTSNIDKLLEKIKAENLEVIHLEICFLKNIDFLGKLNCKKLKFLNLKSNEISDLKILEKVEFEQLKELNLNENKISDISILEKVNFKYLKELIVSNNNISDINVLEKVKFELLEKLDLNKNKISDINVLEKVNFKELKVLKLKENEITDIKVLEKVEFEKLEKLDLGHNKISDISALERVNFKNLKKLGLSLLFTNIMVLEKVKFEKLEKLNISGNLLKNINILEKVNFKYLKELNVGINNISDINVLEKVKFEKLEKLNLGSNELENIDVFRKVNFPNLKKLLLHRNYLRDLNLKALIEAKFKLESLDISKNYFLHENDPYMIELKTSIEELVFF